MHKVRALRDGEPAAFHVGGEAARARSGVVVGLVISLVASLLVPVRAHAQAEGVLRVEVVEAAGAPVQGANVRVGGRTAVTDDGGVASLRLPLGTHRVRIERIGFESMELSVRLARDTMVVVELEAHALEEEEILVHSTRGERRVEDEPVRVEVLTREEIEEKLLMTPGNIAMLLNETAGLRVQETSPSLGGASIRIQGLRGRYTQLLADGLPLYGGQTGALGLVQIPPMDLRQVEVIKGAASALYGASALGGVVNLISRRPDGEREVLLNRTTRGGVDALLWLTSEPGRWGYTVMAGGHAQERTDVDGDGWSDIPRHRRATVRPRFFWTGSDGATLMLTAGGMTEQRSGGGSAPGGAVHVEELSTRRVDFGVSGRLPLRGALLFELRASAFRASHDHGFSARVESDVHDTGFLETSLHGQTGVHAWTFGAAVQRDGFASQDVARFDFVHWVTALFAQDEIAVAPWLALALSARADRHDAYGTFVSPRVSALLRGPADWAVRLSAGTAFFAPTPFTGETQEIGLSRVVWADTPRAERARSIAADLGGMAGGLEVNATLFASVVDDALAVRPADQPGIAELLNVDGEARTRGTELLLRYRREPWGFTASHTYVSATESDPSGAGRRSVPLTPRHALGLIGVYERHGTGRAGVEIYYTGEQALEHDPYRRTSADFVVVGMLFERRAGPVRLFLNLENLTDVRQTRYQPFVRPTPGLYGEWTTQVWAPLEGRVVNGGVRFTF